MLAVLLLGRTHNASAASGRAVVVRVGRANLSASSTESTTNRAGLTLEAIEALLTTSEDTTLLLEVGHADDGKGRGGVDLGSVVVDLVDGNSGVDDSWLNGF